MLHFNFALFIWIKDIRLSNKKKRIGFVDSTKIINSFVFIEFIKNKWKFVNFKFNRIDIFKAYVYLKT